MLETKGDDIPAMSREETRRLLHELQTYQAELELQLEERSDLEERYRLLAENVSDVVWIADIEFECSYVSPSVEQFLGYTVEEIPDISVADVLTPTSAEAVKALTREEQGRKKRGDTPRKRSHTLELEFIRKDGSHVWGEAVVTVLRKPDGAFAHMVGVVHDIQARKMVENELRASEKRLRRTLAATSDGMWDCDLRTNEVYYMPGSGDMLGYAAHEVIDAGRFWKTIVHPDDRPPASAAMRAHIEGQTERYEAEFRCRDKEGEWRWILSRGEVVGWDEDLKATRIVGTHTDITERKQHEERFRRLSAIVEQSTQAIAEADLDGNLLFSNKAFGLMYGYAPEELVGQHLSMFHRAEDMPAVKAANETALAAGEFKGIIPSVRKDGTVFPNMMHNSLLRNAEGKPVGLVGTFRDVSEQMRLEDNLRASEERWRSLAENAPNTIIKIDTEGTVLFLNKTTGAVSRDAVLGTSIFAYIPGAEHGVVRDAMARVFDRGEPASYVHQAGAPSGDVKRYESRMVPITRAGEVMEAIIVATELDE
jgi:PAS domain S-box-containing protein